MRLGAKKRIHFRTRISKGKVSVFLLLVFFLSIVSGGSLYFLKIARPLIMELAKNQATLIAEQAIHRAIIRIFPDTDFSELVTISRLSDGTVSSVSSNMNRVNRLKAEASLAINEEITSIQDSTLLIPLGVLTGNDFFAGLGPRLPISLMPYGKAVVEFESNLTESGINQTLLVVNLKAKVKIGIVLPGISTSKEVTTTMPVTQTVIIGKIPDNYVNIDRVGEDYEGDVLDIIG